MTLRLVRGILLTALVLMLAAAPAQADPITGGEPTTVGAFSWDFDFLFGPIFTVENHVGSGFNFTDVLVNLTLLDTSTVSLDLGAVPEAEIRQTFEDLSLLTISLATLSFDGVFLGDPVAGVFSVVPLTSEGSSTPITFSPTAPGPAPIPEPATLLLVAGGGAIAAVRRRRRHTAR